MLDKLVGVAGFQPATPRPERGELPQNPAFFVQSNDVRPLSGRERVFVVGYALQATRPSLPLPSLRLLHCSKSFHSRKFKQTQSIQRKCATERVTDVGEAPTAASSELLRVAFNRDSISLPLIRELGLQ